MNALCPHCGQSKPASWRSCSRGCSLRARAAARRADPEQGFWSKVDRSGGSDACWPWIGTRKETGYGKAYLGGRKWARAHRLAYEIHYGVAPGDLIVLHNCDNPPCCNPAHLRLGTQLENVADRVERGRGRVPKGDEHPNSKLTADKVREIRRRFVRGRRGDGPRAAREFGVSITIIHQVLRREIWKHVA